MKFESSNLIIITIVDGNERNGRGRCSGRCSLRNGCRRVRLLLALVGALGEPGALGDSDGGGLLCPRCARRCHGWHMRGPDDATSLPSRP